MSAPVDQAVADDDRDPATLAHSTYGHSGAGWYYWSSDYPDEGSVGGFATREEAIEHLREAGMFLELEEPNA